MGTWGLFGDPEAQFPIKYAKQPYAEHYRYDGKMQRDYRLLKEGMSVQLDNFKAHLNALVFINTPGHRRYKFVAYLHEDEHIIPIQFIDWHRVPPTLSHRPLDCRSVPPISRSARCLVLVSFVNGTQSAASV